MKSIDIKEQLVLSLFPYVLNEPIDFYDTLKKATKEAPDFVIELSRFYHHVLLEKEKSLLFVLALLSSEETKHQAKDLLQELVEKPEDVLSVLDTYLALNGKPLPNPLKKELEAIFQTFQKEAFLHAKTQQGTVDFNDFLRLIHPRPLVKEQEDVWGELLKNPQKRTLDVYRDIHQIHHIYSPQDICKMIERDQHITPFRLLATMTFLQKRHIKTDKIVYEALENRLKKNIKALPTLKGKTFLASDLSASMNQPLSPTDVTTYRDIAQFFMLSTLTQCEKAICSFYGSEFELFPTHYHENILETYNRMQTIELGYENHAKFAIEHLLENALFVERIIVFSDKPFIHEEIQELLQTYEATINPLVQVHVFYLAGELEKVYKRNNIHYYSGWNEAFYSLLFFMEHTPNEVVNMILTKKKTSLP